MPIRKAHGGEGDRGGGHLVVRILLFVVIFLLLLPLILILGIRLPAVQKSVISKVTKVVEESTPYGIQIGSFRWQPFARLRIHGLTVRRDLERILECEQVEIGFGLTADSPYIIPLRLDFERPALHLERDAKGRFHLPGGKSESGKGRSPAGTFAGLRIPLPRVFIHSGTLDAQQEGHPVLSVADVSGTLFLQEVRDADGVSRVRIDFGQWPGNAEISEKRK